MPRRPPDPHAWAQQAAKVRSEKPAQTRPEPDPPAPPPPTAANTALQELITAWSDDITDFAACFDLRNKNMELVSFEPSLPQRMVWDTLDVAKLAQFLKGRQMWITTAVVIWNLRACFLQPGIRVCVAAHDDRAAMEISKFYREMHAGNSALVDLMPAVSKGDRVLRFKNGSRILFGTANSEFWRGFPTHIAHLTEAASYDNLGSTLASLGQTVPASGQIILESTAKGENQYHSIWTDKLSKYAKKFLCWLHHPEYVSNDPLPRNLTEAEREYINKHKLPTPRASWWVSKRRAMPLDERHLIAQEYPTTADEAFLLSGDKYLRKPIPMPSPSEIATDGITMLEDYDPTCSYAAGVDTASGSEKGDASTVVITNVTRRRVAATMQTRQPPASFKVAARRFLFLYHDPVTNVEINTYGLEVHDYLRDQGVPQARTVQYKGLVATLMDRHGFTTTADTRGYLYGAIYEACTGETRYEIPCARLVQELNDLCYDKHRKPGAPKNKHDDLATAFGLAVLAAPQAHPPEKKAQDNSRPLSLAAQELQRLQEMGTAALDYARLQTLEMPGDWFD